MDRNDFQALDRGDIVRHVSGSESYLIDANLGSAAIASRIIVMRNPEEWELIFKANYHIGGNMTEVERIQKQVLDVLEMIFPNWDREEFILPADRGITPIGQEIRLARDLKFVDDLGADSLDLVELVMAVEDEFGFEIPDEEAEKLVTVGDLMELVTKKI